MALYKRGNTWWIRYTTPSGKRVRISTKTTDRVEALELHDQLKSESWRTDKLGEIPSKQWNDAAEKWLVETSHKADHKKDTGKIKWLNQHLNGMLLRDINRELISKIAQIKAEHASTTTANRYSALIRAILRKAAFEWDWLEAVPKVRMYKEASRRIRWLTREQADTLIKELPTHQANAARFALATGLRHSNVLGLTWSQVDLSRQLAWIHPDQAKSRKAIAVPLNMTAMNVLESLHGKHDEYVFTYKGNRIQRANTRAWQKALLRAGITDFRWHDLRHTWASWHVQAGTPLNVLQELGGWESVEMVRRYAHLSPKHLAEYADRIVKDTILTQ